MIRRKRHLRTRSSRDPGDPLNEEPSPLKKLQIRRDAHDVFGALRGFVEKALEGDYHGKADGWYSVLRTINDLADATGMRRFDFERAMMRDPKKRVRKTRSR